MTDLIILERIIPFIRESVRQNVQSKESFHCESDFNKWFSKFYFLCGFDKIKQRRPIKYPDYIMLKDGFEIRVELESLSGNFILHKHNPSDADLVICLKINKPLPLPVIEIPSFTYNSNWNIENLKIDRHAHEIVQEVQKEMAKMGMSNSSKSDAIRELRRTSIKYNQLINTLSSCTENSNKYDVEDVLNKLFNDFIELRAKSKRT